MTIDKGRLSEFIYKATEEQLKIWAEDCYDRIDMIKVDLKHQEYIADIIETEQARRDK